MGDSNSNYSNPNIYKDKLKTVFNMNRVVNEKIYHNIKRPISLTKRSMEENYYSIHNQKNKIDYLDLKSKCESPDYSKSLTKKKKIHYSLDVNDKTGKNGVFILKVIKNNFLTIREMKKKKDDILKRSRNFISLIPESISKMVDSAVRDDYSQNCSRKSQNNNFYQKSFFNKSHNVNSSKDFLVKIKPQIKYNKFPKIQPRNSATEEGIKVCYLDSITSPINSEPKQNFYGNYRTILSPENKIVLNSRNNTYNSGLTTPQNKISFENEKLQEIMKKVNSEKKLQLTKKKVLLSKKES
jgi:hypothetical protein